MSEEIKQEIQENISHENNAPKEESYRFSGTYSPKMDDKGRFFVPTKFREFMDADGGCYITMGFDNCLWMYCKAEWDKVAAHLESTLSDMKVKERKLKRFIMGNAKECELDKQGRILIPQDLRLKVGIGDALTVVGMGNKIELWAASSFELPPEDDAQSIEDIAEEIDDIYI